MEGACAKCGTPCTQGCSKCRKVNYCSTSCQKGDWSTHRPICFPATEEEGGGGGGGGSNAKGPYLVTTREVSEGETLFNEVPILIGPTRAGDDQTGGKKTTTCLACCKILKTRQLCPSCKWPLCSTSCPSLAVHIANECPIFTRHKVVFQDEEFEYDIVRIIRCLMLSVRDPIKWQQFLSLPSKTSDSERRKRAMVEILGALAATKDFDEATIVRVMDIEASNKLQQLRKGNKSSFILYDKVHKLDHSCIPNTKTSEIKKGKNKNIESGLSVVATIKIGKGKRLTQSIIYGNIMDGTIPRRKTLHMADIDCHCQRCVDPTELGTFMSGIKCTSQKCKESTEGHFLPLNPTNEETEWGCTNCENKMTAKQVEKLLAPIGVEVEELNSLNDERGFNNLFVFRDFEPQDFECLNRMEKFIEKYDSKVLHPNHYFIFRVKKLLGLGHHAFLGLGQPRPLTTSVQVRDTRLRLLERFQDIAKYCVDLGNVILPGRSLFRGKMLYLLAASKWLKCQEYSVGGGINDVRETFNEATLINEQTRLIFESESEFSIEHILMDLLDNCQSAMLQAMEIHPNLAAEIDRLQI